MSTDTTNRALARDVVAALAARGETLAWCESLTAGLGCATIATVPGASAVLRGGLVTYSTELKATLAGVPEEILATEGPVAARTAQAMAAGTQGRLQSSWALALTGVAGPESQDGHPVGEVWLGVANPEGSALAQRCQSVDGHDLLPGGREEIRLGAVRSALEGLIHQLGQR